MCEFSSSLDVQILVRMLELSQLAVLIPWHGSRHVSLTHHLGRFTGGPSMVIKPLDATSNPYRKRATVLQDARLRWTLLLSCLREKLAPDGRV